MVRLEGSLDHGQLIGEPTPACGTGSCGEEAACSVEKFREAEFSSGVVGLIADVDLRRKKSDGVKTRVGIR